MVIQYGELLKDMLVEWGVISVKIILPKIEYAYGRCLWIQVIPETLTQSFLTTTLFVSKLFKEQENSIAGVKVIHVLSGLSI